MVFQIRPVSSTPTQLLCPEGMCCGTSYLVFPAFFRVKVDLAQPLPLLPVQFRVPWGLPGAPVLTEPKSGLLSVGVGTGNSIPFLIRELNQSFKCPIALWGTLAHLVFSDMVIWKTQKAFLLHHRLALSPLQWCHHKVILHQTQGYFRKLSSWVQPASVQESGPHCQMRAVEMLDRWQ